jgi:hypothetical protein
MFQPQPLTETRPSNSPQLGDLSMELLDRVMEDLRAIEVYELGRTNIRIQYGFYVASFWRRQAKLEQTLVVVF